VNSQSKSYWYEENPMLICEVLWCDVYCLGIVSREHTNGPFISMNGGGIFYLAE
jgi:hypothetical protein